MTLCSSPVWGGIGQTCQNAEVLLLNVLPCPGMSSWVSLERSHPRNSSSLEAVGSYRIVWEAPHLGHLHLCLPALVVPFFFILWPQEAQNTVFIRIPSQRQI